MRRAEYFGSRMNYLRLSRCLRTVPQQGHTPDDRARVKQNYLTPSVFRFDTQDNEKRLRRRVQDTQKSATPGCDIV